MQYLVLVEDEETDEHMDEICNMFRMEDRGDDSSDDESTAEGSDDDDDDSDDRKKKKNKKNARTKDPQWCFAFSILCNLVTSTHRTGKDPRIKARTQRQGRARRTRRQRRIRRITKAKPMQPKQQQPRKARS